MRDGFKTHQLTLPDPVPHNGFGQAFMTLVMIVYDWRDNTRFKAPRVDANGRLLLLPIFANSYTNIQ